MWIKRRWYEFRVGHSTYLSFIPSSLNSVLLAFNLVVIAYLGLDNNPWFLLGFGVLVVVVYGPIAIYAGHLHNNKQMPTDNLIASLKNPITVDFINNFVRIEASLNRIEARLEKLEANTSA
jgi:fumarate reductase subunit C